MTEQNLAGLSRRVGWAWISVGTATGAASVRAFKVWAVWTHQGTMLQLNRRHKSSRSGISSISGMHKCLSRGRLHGQRGQILHMPIAEHLLVSSPLSDLQCRELHEVREACPRKKGAPYRRASRHCALTCHVCRVSAARMSMRAKELALACLI
jgi:hypothetical protein